jgi:hypothetical protein
MVSAPMYYKITRIKMYYNDIVVFEKFPDENVHDSMALCA